MFSNSVYNFPPQFNENLLTQNIAGLSLNSAQQRQDLQQRQNLDYGSFQFPNQQQPMPIDIGGYVPPTVDDKNMKWLAPGETDVSYQRGSTVVRQYNNSMIDDYYKKFIRPITDYVPIPTNGQPTYVYQNLDGQQTAAGAASTQPPAAGGAVASDANAAAPAGISKSNSDGTEEKKHKKKHKKRSSKHSHGESSKNADGEKGSEERTSGTVNEADQQQAPSVVTTGQVYQQQAPPSAAAGQMYQQQAPSSAVAGQVYQQQQQQQQQQRQQVQQQPAAVASESQVGGIGPKAPMRDNSNPVVFFDLEIDGDARGRLVMELFRHVLPRTTQNFLSLCLNEHGFGYRLSYFHRIIPGFMAQGGDFEKSNGTGGYSIYGEKFDDEGFPYLHDRPGLLSMANSGPNTNGSQFFITFVPCPHLDKKHVVFGQVVQGFHLLKDLEMSGSDSGDVSREVKITNSGQLQ